MQAVFSSFRAEFSLPTASPGSIPWESLGPMVGRWQRELISRQHADGSWFDPEPAVSLELAEWLIAARCLPGGLPSETTYRIGQLLHRRDRQGSWGTPEATLVAYLALVLHQVGDNLLRPTREWLVDHPPVALSSRTGLLLRATGQIPRVLVESIGELDSTDDQLSAAVLLSATPPEATPRDPVLNHVFRHWGRLDLSPRWLGQGGAKQRQALRALISWLRSRHRTPSGSVLPMLALRVTAADLDGSLRRQLFDEMGTTGRNAEARANSIYTQLAADSTIDAFLALIEVGLPCDHPALAAADSWLWQRLTRAVASPGCPTDRLARLLIASAALPSPLFEDRTLLIEPALDQLLARQTTEGVWSPMESTGLVLECLGRFGMTVGQPVIDQALHQLAVSQNAAGDWNVARPLLGTAWMVRGALAVGASPQGPMIQQACAALRRELGQQLENHLVRSEPDEGAVPALEALLDAHQLDGGLMGKMTPYLLEARPMTVRGLASLLRLSAKICRATNPRSWF